MSYSPLEGGQTQRLKIGGQWQDVPLQYQSTVALSPEQQQILDLQQRGDIGLGELGVSQLGRISETLNQPLGFDALPDLSKLQGDGGLDRLTQSTMDRLQPRIDRDQAALEARLYGQGLQPGDEAWRAAMDDQSRAVNDLRLGAVGQAGQEQARQLQLRQQQIAEMLQKRSVPINEITALLGGGQVTLPTQAAAGYNAQGVQPGNLSDLLMQQYQTKMQAQQGQNAALASGVQGLGQIGTTAALLFSDRRVKIDVRPTWATLGGHPLYRYRYVWGGGEQVGVMAQDVRRRRPDAVVAVGGVLMVDYERLVLDE